MMLLNGSDLKNFNNSLYEVDPSTHMSDVRQWYVVRDIGAALGETGRFGPRRGDAAAFARIGFIRGLKDGQVQFNYRGRHQELAKHTSLDDLRWMTDLVSGLSDQQWREAFRAGGYSVATSSPFIVKIHERLDEARSRIGPAPPR